jgi:hypothetical protein
MGKAKPRLTQIDRINNIDISKRELYGINRRNATGSPISIASTGISGGGGQGGNTGGSSGVSYLPTAGGTMIGPIAFLPANAVVSGNNSSNITLDVSQTGAYSTLIKLPGGATQTYTNIIGASHNGQILILQAFAGFYTINNTGNIEIINNLTSYSWDSNDAIMLFFDSNVNKWVQLTAAIGSSSSGGANTTLSNLTSPTAINKSLLPASSLTQTIGTVNTPWLNGVFSNIYLVGDSSSRTLQTNVQVSGVSQFVVNNYVDVAHTNIGYVYGINNSSYFQIVHNSLLTPPDFMLFEAPIKIKGTASTQYCLLNINSNFNLYNFIDTVNTNIGHDFQINGVSYLEIVHNTAQTTFTTGDFNYSPVPLWMSGGGTKNFIQFTTGSEPPTPALGNCRLYMVTSGGVRFFLVKWDDGTKSTLASH